MISLDLIPAEERARLLKDLAERGLEFEQATRSEDLAIAPTGLLELKETSSC